MVCNNCILCILHPTQLKFHTCPKIHTARWYPSHLRQADTVNTPLHTTYPQVEVEQQGRTRCRWFCLLQRSLHWRHVRRHQFWQRCHWDPLWLQGQQELLHSHFFKNQLKSGLQDSPFHEMLHLCPGILETHKGYISHRTSVSGTCGELNDNLKVIDFAVR